MKHVKPSTDSRRVSRSRLLVTSSTFALGKHAFTHCEAPRQRPQCGSRRSNRAPARQELLTPWCWAWPPRPRRAPHLARPTEAAPVLQQARGLFHALGAKPGITETDALLQQAVALSS